MIPFLTTTTSATIFNFAIDSAVTTQRARKSSLEQANDAFDNFLARDIQVKQHHLPSALEWKAGQTIHPAQKMLPQFESVIKSNNKRKLADLFSSLNEEELNVICTSSLSISKPLLHTAIEQNNLETLDFLLSVTTSPFVIDSESNSVFHLAVSQNSDQVLSTLLEKTKDSPLFHISISSPNSKGLSPLHIACQNGNDTAVELLIKAGSQIVPEKSFHKIPSPLEIARSKKHSKCVDLLETYS